MRQRFTQWLSLLAVFFMLAAYGSRAQAALQAVGPLDLANGFPTWYQDANAVALVPCLSLTLLPSGNQGCVLPAQPPFYNPGIAMSFPGNYPFEVFYFIADSNATTMTPAPDPASPLATFVYRAALEATFGTAAPAAGGQVTFSRVRMRMDAPLAGTYTITHPFGTETINVTTPGIKALNLTRDLGITPFPTGPLAGDLGPWLIRKSVAPVYPLTVATGETFIGDFNFPGPVTGSPTGNNFIRIVGPVGSNLDGLGNNTVTTANFAVAGKVFTGQIPSPLTLDRTTYARNAATGQVDLFVTALPTAAANLVVTGTNIAPTTLAEDIPNSGKFFAHISFAALPTGVVVTNNLDVPPVAHPVTLVDEVNVTQAAYDPITKNLTIKAASRDKVAPLPVLTVPAFAAPNTLDVTGTLVVALATTIPPQNVQVVSSKGGSAVAPVSVLTPPPVANNDNASVAALSSVVIDVLANDTATAPATKNATSVVASLATRGTVAVNAVTGAITYTPTGPAAGTDSFTYTVTDTNLHVSNAATVTVTIIAQSTPPVAANVAATTLTGSVVTIATSATATAPATINPATLLLTVPTGGTATANLNGTVTYTAPATPGAYSFSYTVKDNALLPATSNPATVTITVTAPHITPVAVNDAVATAIGSPVTINLIANDTATAPSIINPASVVVTQPAALGGSVVNNLNGTATYTPPALAGTYTFTYTVKDNFATPATSNVATVTVIVAATNVAPAAGNDSAATLINGTITINLIANDTSTTSTINPTSVVVTQPAALQGSVINNLNGTVTYTAPTAASAVGVPYTFTYTVKDNAVAPATSNVATVSVTVASANIPPVANNDTAAATTNGTVLINVIANDTSVASTINPASVVVTQPAAGQGSVVNNLNGTVTYTAPAAASPVGAPYTFTYTVLDSAAAPATSNTATVTVTVTAPSLPPVANPDGPVNMTAAAGANTVVTVLANDTFTAPATSLNPASVTIVTPPANGTAVVNLATGAITYTPTAGFVGSNTISYTVRDNLGLVSGTASFTVTVAPAISNEVLAVTLAQYGVAAKEWRVEGTTNFRVGETVSVYNDAAMTQLIGSVTIAATTGSWKVGVKPSLISPTVPPRISVQSTQGGVLTGVTVTVR
jgi:hypothetical protein